MKYTTPKTTPTEPLWMFSSVALGEAKEAEPKAIKATDATVRRMTLIMLKMSQGNTNDRFVVGVIVSLNVATSSRTENRIGTAATQWKTIRYSEATIGCETDTMLITVPI